MSKSTDQGFSNGPLDLASKLTQQGEDAAKATDPSVSFAQLARQRESGADTASSRSDTDTIVRSLRELFERFADNDGVTIKFSKTRLGMLLIKFRTPEDFGVQFEFDLNEFVKDRRYLDATLSKLQSHLGRGERDRHENILVLPERLQ